MGNKILLIAGMHRSGTSLITQWLHRCGLFIGEELMEANGGNEQGYFEDMQFVRLHEDILTGAGLPHTGLTEKSLPSLSTEDQQRIIDLLAGKSHRHDQWAWKDPRTCLFLSVYRQLAADADCLVIYRDFRFCVYSLVNRMLKYEEIECLQSGNRDAVIRWKQCQKKRIEERLLSEYAEEYLKVWIRYNQEILDHIEAVGVGKSTVIDYQSLLANDSKLIRIIADWGFRLDYVPFHEVYSEKLMNRHAVIEPYIGDKDLISEADRMADRLKARAII
jgi:hypothetical protein